MSPGLEMSAKAAKSGVRAARKSAAKVVARGRATASHAVDVTGRRAEDSLDMVETAVLGLLNAVAQRGRGYAKDAKDRLYTAEARLFPRPRRPLIATALAGVGAGVLLSLLLAPKTPAKTARAA
jgi:hypothetical protein